MTTTLTAAPLKPQQQTTCNQCPLWQRSNKTPNVGHCPHYEERTMGHDKAGENCPAPQPLYEYTFGLFMGEDNTGTFIVTTATYKEANQIAAREIGKRWDVTEWNYFSHRRVSQ